MRIRATDPSRGLGPINGGTDANFRLRSGRPPSYFSRPTGADWITPLWVIKNGRSRTQASREIPPHSHSKTETTTPGGGLGAGFANGQRSCFFEHTVHMSRVGPRECSDILIPATGFAVRINYKIYSYVRDRTTRVYTERARR